MIRARKRFGQHFLEPVWRARVAEACAIGPEDDIVEIGPGTGALTEFLVAHAHRVLAIEVDRDLGAALAARNLAALRVHVGDVLHRGIDGVLDAWLGSEPTRRFRVAGNLPYNITSPILALLARWASARPGLVDATVMVQAEVADRLTAVPSTSDYGVLTLTTALRADVRRLLDLPPGAFRPRPKVASALVRLSYRPPPPGVVHPALISRLVRAAFMQRRKTLANALKPLAAADGLDPAAAIAAAGLDGRRRPETLQLLEFSALADRWAASATVHPVL
ncbi:MAG: 16S rRNA (adenine(1518)-N(6)/adenine(1519)-N(6))-dimethyltransferase RsmA [Vicinamibacterales bacterium]